MAKIGFNTRKEDIKVKHYRNDVFPTVLTVMRYDDNTSECLEMIDTDADLNDDRMASVTFGGKKDGAVTIAIAFKGNPSLETIVHECSHAATAYCYLHDLPYRVNEDESHAFLSEWIFRCVCGFYGINTSLKY